jgi:hypothetical protein
MERRKILIATKTYPSISRKYKETVCTAGILLDDDEKPLQWIRIYPIRFRDLEFERRYKRWSIISAEIEKDTKDPRSESYKINDSSIKTIRQIDTKNNWAERKSFVLPFESSSIAEIKAQDKSLGIIKPASITKYFHQGTEREWKPQQKMIRDQLDLFEPSVQLLEKIPYQFGYEFISTDGTKHKYTTSDWEIAELYRKCRDSSLANSIEEKEQDALLKVKQKMDDEFLSKKDLYFIVGNLKTYPKTFMIIGIFYPMKSKDDDQNQLSIFTGV